MRCAQGVVCLVLKLEEFEIPGRGGLLASRVPGSRIWSTPVRSPPRAHGGGAGMLVVCSLSRSKSQHVQSARSVIGRYYFDMSVGGCATNFSSAQDIA